MRTTRQILGGIGLFATLVAVAGCGKFTASTAAGKKARETASAQLRNPAYDLVVGESVVYGNLAVFPVSTRSPKNDDSYITLDEGLKAGVVEVFETGAASGATMAPNPPGNPSPALGPDGNPTADLDVQFTQDSFQSSNTQLSGQPPAQEAIEPPAPETESQTEAAPNQEALPQQQLAVQNNDPFDNNDAQYTQRGAGNDVNRLMVWNKSDKPLYLMPGEIILGGSQDRTIGQELVLAPSDKPVPVEVFCVEHGRWGGRGADRTEALIRQVAGNEVSGQSVHVANAAGGQVAEEADRGKFIASVGQLSKNARMAVQVDKAQGKVWENVALENSKAGVSNDSDTFTANYTSEQAMARLDPYIAALEKQVAEGEQVVGVIVAIDGKVASMDIFQSTPLFRKLWPKLLKSYALDAANEAAPVNAEGKPVVKNFAACSTDTAHEFLCEALTNDNAQTDVKDGLATTTRRSQRMTSFAAQAGATVQLPTVHPNAASSAAPADAVEAYESEAVHVSAFAH